MAHSFANPFSGKKEETCSVSFAAQQQMGAHTTGSPQTEAEFNKSKQLGEWGVLTAKFNKGEIPTGTKLLTFSNEHARGYLYAQGKAVHLRSYSTTTGKLTLDEPSSLFQGEAFIKSKQFVTAIPQAVDPKPIPHPLLSGQAIHDLVKKGLYKKGSLTPQQRKSLKVYETGWGPVINHWLRQGAKVEDALDKQTANHVANIDAAMEGTALSNPIKVYRGMLNSHTVFGKDGLKSNLEGFSWQDKAYGSTTTSLDVTNSFISPDDNTTLDKGENVVLTVRVAAGTKVLEVSTETKGSEANGPQAEILLQRNMKWRVVKDNGYDENGVRQLEVEAYPGDAGTDGASEDGGAAAGGTGDSSQPAKAPVKASAGSAQPIASPTPSPAVNPGSSSVGSMSHEDVAAMFVKIKDDLAKEQGLNIKGANPQLDQLVYGKIGEATGYTGAEVKAKIDAYKADGNKLSALKKKVVSGKYKVPEGKPAPAKQSAPNSPLAQPAAKAKVPDPKPNGVPTTATPKIATEIKKEVQAEVKKEPAKAYSDEDVAAAYIIAKDAIVASNTKGWTLYTKNEEFDLEIAIAVGLKTGLSPIQQKQAIANYLASGKKLSALKKQLAKQGAFQPQADTLKKTGAAKTQAEKKADVEAKADAGFTPTPEVTKTTDGVKADTAKPAPQRVKREANQSGDISGISPETQLKLFNAFKGHGFKTYLSSTSGENYDAFLEVQVAQQAAGNDYSLLQLIRIVDEQGAKKAGVENGKLFEKKVATWLTTPDGTAYIKKKEADKAKLAEQAKAKAEAQKLAKELEANQPPLPADSALFQEMSPTKALDLQQQMLREKPFGPGEFQGIKHYTGSAYHAMNGHLRGISKASGTDLNSIPKAQRGMRPSPENILVRRGTGANQFITLGVDRGETHLLWGLTGKTFEDKGFLSTSAAGRAAFGGEVALEIECPVGTPMMYVDKLKNDSGGLDSFSKHPGENEMLLGTGLKYKILNVRKAPNGTTFVMRLRVVDWPGKE